MKCYWPNCKAAASVLSFLLLSFLGFSQSNIDGENEIKHVLTPEIQSKINKSDQLFKQAEKYDAKAKTYDQEIEDLKSDAEGNSTQINKLTDKKNACIIDSKHIIDDAYQIKFKAYQSQADILAKENPDKTSMVSDWKSQGDKQFSEAQKLFRKAENTGSSNKQVELIAQGKKTYIEAITTQIKIVRTLADNKSAVVVTEKTSKKDSIVTPKPTPLVTPTTAPVAAPAAVVAPAVVPVTTTAVVAATTIPVAATPPPPPITAPKPAPIAVNNASNDVFLTVQIMASVKPCTPEQIAQVYKGGLNVMEFKSDDYYRYNIGRFNNTDDAKKFITANNLKGFVVAYKDSQRISVSEATAIINSTK